jgi:hypothetical protein
MNTVDAIASLDHVSVQERVVGDVRWVALRARGADWSWLTPQEAVELARGVDGALRRAMISPLSTWKGTCKAAGKAGLPP